MKDKIYTIRCDDNAEALVFTKLCFKNDKPFYSLDVEDSYCRADYMGIRGRFKRASHAFFAKPIVYSGICIQDGDRLEMFLKDCLAAVQEG